MRTLAAEKDAVKETPDGLTLYRYRDLLGHLATLTRQVINFNGQHIEKITTPTPVQARAFELLGSPVPVRLTQPEAPPLTQARRGRRRWWCHPAAARREGKAEALPIPTGS